MKFAASLIFLINGYKTYASVILAVVSGIGMILSKNYGGGVSEICQALTLIFGGTTAVALRHSVTKLEASHLANARRPLA